MMSDTLKQMNHVLGRRHVLSAKVYYSQKKEPSYIVMEDLAPLGYKMCNRLQGLDLQHALLAVQGLARFHASSIVLCERVCDINIR